ncbi:hypothetical protein DIZ27_28330 [Streptomyces sp. NWU339]|uniref:hypothetical protein n=1 Tax=Streptomyces sp. NWU339 TaxID=2185284 RepID=UPI000D672F25|nr:hypothetical protein [Streptomyces sp. NWU339]PWI07363.1 hypothetical protein DIZ27_28330 [Streptomyces sp. NWU339]
MAVSHASDTSVTSASTGGKLQPPPTPQQGTQDGRADGEADGANCKFKGKNYQLHKSPNGNSQYKGNYEFTYQSSYNATCEEAPGSMTPNGPTPQQGTQDGRTDGEADGANCKFKGKNYQLHKSPNGNSQYKGNYEFTYQSSYNATCEEA